MDQSLIVKVILGVVGAYICIVVLKFIFKIIKTVIIASLQIIIGIVELITNIIRNGYNLFVPIGQKLTPIVFPKLLD